MRVRNELGYMSIPHPAVRPHSRRLVDWCALRGCLRQFRLSGRQSNSQSKSDKVSPTCFFLPAYENFGQSRSRTKNKGRSNLVKAWSNQKIFVNTPPLPLSSFTHHPSRTHISE